MAGNSLPGVKFRARHSNVVRAGEGRRTLGVSKLEPHQIHSAPAIRGDPAEEEAAVGSGAERGGGLGAGTEGVTRSNWKGAKPLPALAPPRLRARALHSAWGSPAGRLRPGGELSSRAPRTSSSVPPQPGPKRLPAPPGPQAGEGAVRDEQGAPGPRAAPRPRSTERPSGGKAGAGGRGGGGSDVLRLPARIARPLGTRAGGEGAGLGVGERIVHPQGRGLRHPEDRACSGAGVHASSGGFTPPQEGHAFAGIPEGLGGGAECPGLALARSAGVQGAAVAGRG